MKPADWEKFSICIENLHNKNNFTKLGPREDGHINLRKYIDLEDVLVKEFISQIINSSVFKKTMEDAVGFNYEISSIQVWRNESIDFLNNENTLKEINSSNYHFDNGNKKLDRLSVNIFMYLSKVTNENGPFMFYDSKTSKKINRKFINEIWHYGDLRQKKIIDKIESYFKPNTLLLSPGEAVIIDNQICLHRAGICQKSYRDILEIVIRPKSLINNA